MNNINTYVSEKLKAGADLEALRRTLLAVGWKEDTVSEAIAKALVAQGVPSPVGAVESGVHRASAVEVVVNFFSFVLLTVVAVALGALYFGIIDRYFPDPLQNMYGTSEAVHYAIAALLVAFPLYVIAVRMWFRRFREDKEKEESKLSKWLTYIVLLITALTIVGDLITVIFNFLQGEVAVRFYLKALTVLGIASVIFGFYFFERKKIQYKKDIPRQMFLNFGYGISGVVLVGIVLGFFAAGTPGVERIRQLDQTRANDLRNLANCISQFGNERGTLPETLSTLEGSSAYAYCSTARFDPVTRTEYEYAVVQPIVEVSGQKGVKQGSFELCAAFEGDAIGSATSPNYNMAYPYNDKWAVHPAGRACDTEIVTVKEPVTVPVPVVR